MIVRILSENPKNELGVIQEYLVRKLEVENQAIEEDELEIEDYRVQTEAMKKDIEDLSTK